MDLNVNAVAATFHKTRLNSSEINSDIYSGVAKTCQFVSWSILEGLANTVLKWNNTEILHSMRRGFDSFYSNQFCYEL